MYAQSALLSRGQKKQNKHHSLTTTDGEVAQDGTAFASPKVKRKRKMAAKNYLRHEDKLQQQLPTFGDFDPNLPSEYALGSFDERRHSGQ